MKITKILAFILLVNLVAFLNASIKDIKTDISMSKYRVSDENSQLKKYFDNNNKESTILVKTYLLEIVEKVNDDLFYDSQELNNPVVPFNKLVLTLNFISPNTINFIISDFNKILKEVPREEPFPFHNIVDDKISNTQDHKLLEKVKKEAEIFQLFNVEINKHEFSLKITRKSTKEVLFDTENSNIVLSKSYLKITSNLPNTFDIFGLGERTTSFKLKTGIYTLYNKDLFAVVDNLKGGNNRYGSHPMYLMREVSNFYHVVYLRNTYPMDVLINLNDTKSKKIQYRVTGGVFDFTIFLGNEKETKCSFTGKTILAKNPTSAISLYHDFIGNFTLPPFWSMGFQQSRWGYDTKEKIEKVLNNYHTHKIPLDVIWMDIDYMISKKPFTFDESRYGPVAEFNKMINKHNKKFVMIVEPEIGLNKIDSEDFREAVKKNLFIKTNEGSILLNRVWPGICAFYDYFNPKILQFWGKQLDKFYSEKIQFNGVWLDMNEIATFRDGSINADDQNMYCNDGELPFSPGRVNIDKSTICSTALHYKNVDHVLVHNYYGTQQAVITNKYLSNKFKNEFPFILTRSNAPGTGKYASHWSGDNKGTQVYLENSIIEIFNSGLFGIPHIGADICGFGDNTTDDMCAKWYQIGALYPFSRSHNHLDYKDKEPFYRNKVVLNTTKKSVIFRYSIVKHYYSEFIKLNGRGMLFKPLLFEFDSELLNDLLDNSILEKQFMIGSQLMVIPNFVEGSEISNLISFKSFLNSNSEKNFTNISSCLVDAYFPGLKDNSIQWLDLRDYSKVVSFDSKSLSFNESTNYAKVYVMLEEIPAVYLKSGELIFQNIINSDIYDSSNLSNEFSIIAGLQNEYSHGSFTFIKDFNNKKEVLDCQKNNCLLKVDITEYKNQSIRLKFTLPKLTEYKNSITVDKLVLFGFTKELNEVFSNKSLNVEIGTFHNSTQNFSNDALNNNKNQTKINFKKINDAVVFENLGLVIENTLINSTNNETENEIIEFLLLLKTQ